MQGGGEGDRGWDQLHQPARLSPPNTRVNPDGSAPPQALAIAAQLLGDRPLECTAGFSVLLQHHAEDAEPLEVQEHFWCPEGNQEDSEEEASRNGPFRKVRVLTFLKLLCNEAQRLNISISNASPRLFREWDDDADGQIVR